MDIAEGVRRYGLLYRPEIKREGIAAAFRKERMDGNDATIHVALDCGCPAAGCQVGAERWFLPAGAVGSICVKRQRYTAYDTVRIFIEIGCPDVLLAKHRNLLTPLRKDGRIAVLGFAKDDEILLSGFSQRHPEFPIEASGEGFHGAGKDNVEPNSFRPGSSQAIQDCAEFSCPGDLWPARKWRRRVGLLVNGNDDCLRINSPSGGGICAFPEPVQNVNGQAVEAIKHRQPQCEARDHDGCRTEKYGLSGDALGAINRGSSIYETA